MKAIILIDGVLGDLPFLNQCIVNFGLDIEDKNNISSLDIYKIFAHKISNGKHGKGFIFTTYGIDAFLVTNKIKNIRAAFVTDEVTAKLCIEHNNANIIIFPLYIISERYSIKLMEIILAASFQGSRHSIRVDMLNKL